MLRQILTIIAILISFLSIGCETSLAAYPTAKVTARVVDESGSPVQGANVHISFEVVKRGGWGTDNFGIKGISDHEGSFTGEAKASERIGITVRKEGYYFSRKLYEFKSRSRLLNRWEPWNPTVEVVLKKKRNPVAMYKKYIEWVPVPTLNKPIGYDFEKGDWVAPYGKGVIEDFVFSVKSEQRAWTDYDTSYTLTFSNEKDGIQEFLFDHNDQSNFKWPYEAPEDGYVSSMQRFRNDSPQTGYKSNEKKGVNYLFRVRTKTDNDGNIVAAKYGKIEGEIRVVPEKIQFFYYFNPDGTRNLEHDPDKNLFGTGRRRR